ncbi:class I SAM-dependent methyltransferase [Microbulbifer sp. JMSA004]|uniref:class I SAM-dependent methyltransferase n=1 Tax=Microbulbifer sp. JMSA004 TaxID=3243370 RepID=UPI0040397D99
MKNLTPPPADTAHEAGLAALPAELATDSGLAKLPAAMQRLEFISLRAIMELFSSSGALTPESVGRGSEEIINTLGAACRHHWLVRRWLVALVEREFLKLSNGNYSWEQIPESAVGADKLPEAYGALGFPPEMAESHQKLLRHLSELVRDQVSINQLLFENGEILTALAAYQNNWFTTYLNYAAAYIVKQAVKPGPMLRVLELGGGAGLTTSAILDTLAGRPVNYRFTDVSPVFTTAAQKKFRNHIGLRCSLLDINVDFSVQSIAPASTDIVVAGNVLHNAAHIGQTLKRIRRSLVPGGWLLFSESTRDNHAMLTAMQFLLSPAESGTLLGSEDRRRGSDQVFIDSAAWQEELVSAGFEIKYFLAPSTSPLSVAGQTLFVARAV